MVECCERCLVQEHVGQARASYSGRDHLNRWELNHHIDSNYSGGRLVREDMEPWQENVRSCLRSGLCCKKATCWVGLRNGAQPQGCKFLKGDRPGHFYCELAANDPAIASELYVGEGCCMPLFNQYRAEALENNPALRELIER